jgi:hypothetical protein
VRTTDRPLRAVRVVVMTPVRPADDRMHRALFALVGHDLHESNARGIVDADMDELPADAVVAVDGAGPGRTQDRARQPFRSSNSASGWHPSPVRTLAMQQLREGEGGGDIIILGHVKIWHPPGGARGAGRPSSGRHKQLVRIRLFFLIEIRCGS